MATAPKTSKYSLTNPRTYQEAVDLLKLRTDYTARTAVWQGMWNRAAPSFWNSFTEHKAIHLSYSIGDLANLSTARNVLETAAGAGIAAQRYATLLPEGGHITVTDFAAAYSTNWNQWPQNDKISYEVADAVTLKYEDETFDRYICCSGVTQFFRPDIAFKEAFRVLKSGGILVANMPITCSYEEIMFYPTRTLGIIPSDPTDLLCTIDDPRFLVALSEEAGFVDIKVSEDVCTIAVDEQTIYDHAKSLLGPAVSRAPAEVQQQWEEKLWEVIRYFLDERKEFVNYKTLTVRAVKPVA
mmetsp:Transcript_27970/g.50126  ORF Transcript_27970/g.50126 Transcript_27970/m.50126 type:complete len:298 (-) Transcript_27970:859-1752(-)